MCDLVDDLVKQCGGDPRLRRAAGDHAAANDVHRTMMLRAEEQMRTGGVGGAGAGGTSGAVFSEGQMSGLTDSSGAGSGGTAEQSEKDKYTA